MVDKHHMIRIGTDGLNVPEGAEALSSKKNTEKQTRPLAATDVPVKVEDCGVRKLAPELEVLTKLGPLGLQAFLDQDPTWH